MARLLTSIAFVTLLSACQTTTNPPQSTALKTVSTSSAACEAQYQDDIDALDVKIAELQKQTSRGYQNTASPIKINNPLKLCKGIGPFARACLPTPTPSVSSSLPTYEAYRAMKAELQTLEAEKAALVGKQKACSI